MSIQMIGIDHNKATVDQRAIFSLTKKKMQEIMEQFLALEGINGNIIISTCNRMEIWFDTDEKWNGSVFETLCSFKGVDPLEHKKVFVHRKDNEAIVHLFELSSGLKSQIFGEDQIITQVKDALTFSRENGFTSSVLEVLFRMAITAGKKVKTNVVFNRANLSAVDQAILMLKNNGVNLEEKICMVIGNGQMGKLCANAFLCVKSKVLVTVRAYKHSDVIVPEGAEKINYDERENFFDICDIIIGATTSPHFTVTYDMIKNRKNQKKLTLIDLAVPRDIDTKIKELENVELFDIDDFSTGKKDDNILKSLEQARAIIQEEIDEFYSWLSGSALISRIEYIKEEVGADLSKRLRKKLGKVAMPQSEKDEFKMSIEMSAQNVTNKLLFALKKSMTSEEFTKCLASLEELYSEE